MSACGLRQHGTHARSTGLSLQHLCEPAASLAAGAVDADDAGDLALLGGVGADGGAHDPREPELDSGAIGQGGDGTDPGA